MLCYRSHTWNTDFMLFEEKPSIKGRFCFRVLRFSFENLVKLVAINTKVRLDSPVQYCCSIVYMIRDHEVALVKTRVKTSKAIF